MFIDNYGNEFKTEKEVEEFVRKKFYEDEEEFHDYVECEFSVAELMDWILKNDKEKFINDHKDIIAKTERLYVEDYFINYDVEEIEE